MVIKGGAGYRLLAELPRSKSEHANFTSNSSPFRLQERPNSRHLILGLSGNSNHGPGEHSNISPGEVGTGNQRPNRRLSFLSKPGIQSLLTMFEEHLSLDK
jgi:hypothetical protein